VDVALEAAVGAMLVLVDAHRVFPVACVFVCFLL
jgi:hypothetical protein